MAAAAAGGGLPRALRPAGAGPPAAALLRYAPGAAVPAHRHTDYEHILVLRGSQRDADGHYPAGTLLVSPPGSWHAVGSEAGCLVLAIWAGALDFTADG